jgi:AraC-like DNA-binding protein
MSEKDVSRNENYEFLRGQFLESLNFELLLCGVSRFKHEYSESERSVPNAVISQVKFARVLTLRKGFPPIEKESGSASITPADLPVSSRTILPPGGEVVFRWAHLKFTVMSAFDALSFFELPADLSGETAERFGDFNEEMTRIKNSRDLPPLAAAAGIKKTGFEIFDLICRVVPMRETRKDFWDDLRRVAPALDYINSSLTKKMTVHELARKAGMSVPRFHAVFKNATGSAPVEHLIKQRMRHAQRLLLPGGPGVREVAEACGYEDQFFFSRTFKNHTGMSPLEYRRKTPGLLCAEPQLTAQTSASPGQRGRKAH